MVPASIAGSILLISTLLPDPQAAAAAKLTSASVAPTAAEVTPAAAEVATPDDIIFDGNRLISPIPNYDGNPPKQPIKAPQTRVQPVGRGLEEPATGSPPPTTPERGAASSSFPTNASPQTNIDGFLQDSPKKPAIASPSDQLVHKAERKIESTLAQSEQDLTMYQQMSQVVNWLNQYCVWNHRWPEPVDETNQAVNQLCELVPNNPYKWKSRVQESEGQSTDPDYLYYNQPMNQPTDGSTGFEGDSPDPGTSFEALGKKRIKLVLDASLTVAEVKEWETDPPQEWREAPGTITGISNAQNLIVVWGSGADGKPLRVPGSRKTRIFISNVEISESGAQE